MTECSLIKFLGIEKGKGIQNATRKSGGGYNHYIHLLTMVLVSWVYTNDKTQQILYFKYIYVYIFI